MVRSSTLDTVARLLSEQAPALGLSIPELRRRYPARQVRRTQILAALRHFEALGVVESTADGLRWIGPLPEDARPLDLPMRRLARDLALAPAERVRLAAELSEALALRRHRDGPSS